MSPSTAHPEGLPDIAGLRRLTQSLAMLDAIICPEWDYRSHSYNSKWAPGEEMASMRNGCGDDWFLLFDGYGAALKGFAHELQFGQDGFFARLIQEMVPPGFASFLHEPAFNMEMATFCLWRRHTDSSWNVVAPANACVSPEEDGSAELLETLDDDPGTYHALAEACYERTIQFKAVQAIFEHRPLDQALVALLNPNLDLPEVEHDAGEIGYPLNRPGL